MSEIEGHSGERTGDVYNAYIGENDTILATDPLYPWWNIPGGNPYNQSRAYPGQASVFPSRVMYTGYVGNFHWNMPIVARMQQPIKNYADSPGYFAPPVPHSTSVGDYQRSAARGSRQSDIALANLKAPRFSTN
jgi:hypothetical protein